MMDGQQLQDELDEHAVSVESKHVAAICAEGDQLRLPSATSLSATVVSSVALLIARHPGSPHPT